MYGDQFGEICMWILGFKGLNSGMGLTNSVRITNRKVISQR